MVYLEEHVQSKVLCFIISQQKPFVRTIKTSQPTGSRRRGWSLPCGEPSVFSTSRRSDCLACRSDRSAHCSSRHPVHSAPPTTETDRWFLGYHSSTKYITTVSCKLIDALSVSVFVPLGHQQDGSSIEGRTFPT